MTLVDTHVFLWLQSAPERLGEGAMAQLRGGATIWVSSITQAECRIKAAIGKLRFPEALLADLTAQGYRELPFTHSHAKGLAALPDQLARHDPFDRMLLAQAMVEQIGFLTSDHTLLALGLPFVRDARA